MQPDLRHCLNRDEITAANAWFVYLFYFFDTQSASYETMTKC